MRGIGVLFALAFGLVFGAAGVFILFETSVPTYRDWQAMKTGRPASAQLLDVSRARNRTGASYRYEIGGVSYQTVTSP